MSSKVGINACIAAYLYTIQCCSTTQHANADALSWLLIKGASEESIPILESILIIENLQDALTHARLHCRQQETLSCQECSSVPKMGGHQQA